VVKIVDESHKVGVVREKKYAGFLEGVVSKARSLKPPSPSPFQGAGGGCEGSTCEAKLAMDVPLPSIEIDDYLDVQHISNWELVRLGVIKNDPPGLKEGGRRETPGLRTEDVKAAPMVAVHDFCVGGLAAEENGCGSESDPEAESKRRLGNALLRPRVNPFHNAAPLISALSSQQCLVWDGGSEKNWHLSSNSNSPGSATQTHPHFGAPPENGESEQEDEEDACEGEGGVHTGDTGKQTGNSTGKNKRPKNRTFRSAGAQRKKRTEDRRSKILALALAASSEWKKAHPAIWNSICQGEWGVGKTPSSIVRVSCFESVLKPSVHSSSVTSPSAAAGSSHVLSTNSALDFSVSQTRLALFKVLTLPREEQGVGAIAGLGRGGARGGGAPLPNSPSVGYEIWSEYELYADLDDFNARVPLGTLIDFRMGDAPCASLVGRVSSDVEKRMPFTWAMGVVTGEWKDSGVTRKFLHVTLFGDFPPPHTQPVVLAPKSSAALQAPTHFSVGEWVFIGDCRVAPLGVMTMSQGVFKL